MSDDFKSWPQWRHPRAILLLGITLVLVTSALVISIGRPWDSGFRLDEKVDFTPIPIPGERNYPSSMGVDDFTVQPLPVEEVQDSLTTSMCRELDMVVDLFGEQSASSQVSSSGRKDCVWKSEVGTATFGIYSHTKTSSLADTDALPQSASNGDPVLTADCGQTKKSDEQRNWDLPVKEAVDSFEVKACVYEIPKQELLGARAGDVIGVLGINAADSDDGQKSYTMYYTVTFPVVSTVSRIKDTCCDQVSARDELRQFVEAVTVAYYELVLHGKIS